MPISKDDARAIAREFLELSHMLGTYRFVNWPSLTPDQRRRIEDAEWDLLNYSSSLVTTAVGIVLADMENDLRAITHATSLARSSIATIGTVKDVIGIAAALVVLGGAIVSRTPSTILSAAGQVVDAVQKAT